MVQTPLIVTFQLVELTGHRILKLTKAWQAITAKIIQQLFGLLAIHRPEQRCRSTTHGFDLMPLKTRENLADIIAKQQRLRHAG